MPKPRIPHRLGVPRRAPLPSFHEVDTDYDIPEDVLAGLDDDADVPVRTASDWSNPFAGGVAPSEQLERAAADLSAIGTEVVGGKIQIGDNWYPHDIDVAAMDEKYGGRDGWNEIPSFLYGDSYWLRKSP